MSKLIRHLARVSPEMLWSFVRDPGMVAVRLQRPPADGLAEGILTLFPHVAREHVEAARLDLIGNHHFFDTLNRRFAETRRRRIRCEEWTEFLYLLIRLTEPTIVVETGVFDGISSSFILQAMYDYKGGRLISIDLPATETIVQSTHLMRETTLPVGTEPGWVIPEYLRERHELHLGDSRTILPEILKKHQSIGVFFHDSLHTFDHQYFEYRTAWPFIIPGGLLLSDDIYWNSAFHRFAREHSRRYVHIAGFGAIAK